MTNKPIYILHVLGYFDRGGAEAVVMNLFRSIDDENIRFGFVVHGERIGAFEEEVKKAGAEVFRVPDYKGHNHIEYKKAWVKIFDNNPEYSIIHAHVRSTANIYLRLAKKRGFKTIAHSHNTSSGEGFVAKVKDAFQYNIRYYADEFIGCSEEAGKWLFGKRIVKQSNFHILNNAINTDEFKYDKEVRTLKRKELELDDKLIIGHVGRFHEQKNHSFLIDIFNEVQKNKPNAVLLLIGEGNLKQSIIEKVDMLSLSEKVKFLGLRSDVNELLQAMDVFLFPSLFEGLPVTLVETQASGLPAVISDTITKEIRITHLIEYVSLNETPQKWAEIILSKIDKTQRNDTSELIKSARYDITVTANWYTKYIKGLYAKV